jgi:predicted CXXCH cytochrome family protein
MYRGIFKGIFKLFIVMFVLAAPMIVYAVGGHDGLTCTGCHALHTAKINNLIFAVDPNTKDLNPKTKQPYGGISALCLGCHESPEKGGQGIKPISGHLSHPFGMTSINPKVARVSNELLKDGKFECISCHDPHPSNPNYKYLRVDTNNGAKMEVFCAACHPMKADPKTAGGKARMFSSMDERSGDSSAMQEVKETPTAVAAKKRQ